MRKALVVYRFKPLDARWGHGNMEASIGTLNMDTIFKCGDFAAEHVNKELRLEGRPTLPRKQLIVTNVIILEE